MLANKAIPSDKAAASVDMGSGIGNGARGGGVFHFKCYDKDGNLKWEDKAHNLVVNDGLADMNDKYFSGSGYSATWYLGLIKNCPSSFIRSAVTGPCGITALTRTFWFLTKVVAIYYSLYCSSRELICNVNSIT